MTAAGCAKDNVCDVKASKCTAPLKCTRYVLNTLACTCGRLSRGQCQKGKVCDGQNCLVVKGCNDTELTNIACTCGTLACAKDKVCYLKTKTCNAPAACTKNALTTLSCTCGSTVGGCVKGKVCEDGTTCSAVKTCVDKKQTTKACTCGSTATPCKLS